MSKTIIHIGSPKAGSKFLQAYFKQHPDLYFGYDDFWEFSIDGRLDETLRHLKAEHSISVFSAEKLVCPSFYVSFRNGGYDQINNIGKYQEETARQLSEWAPDAYVLFIVRGFQSVVPSLYSQHIAAGGVETYAEFLENYQQEVTQIYNYDYIYQVYRGYFEEEKILVVPFELLKTDKDVFLKLIEDQFDVPHHHFISKKVNKSLSPKHIDFYRRLSKFAYRVIRLFPPFLRRRLTNLYIHALESGVMIKIKDTFLSKKGELELSPETKAKEEAVLMKMIDNAKEITQLKHVYPFSEYYR